MLQREAEQASDDQVVHATDRPEDYARGLTSVAEMASLNETLKIKLTGTDLPRLEAHFTIE